MRERRVGLVGRRFLWRGRATDTKIGIVMLVAMPRALVILILLGALLLLAAAVRMWVGLDVGALNDASRAQILALRWHRVEAAGTVGAALAAAGVMLQILLRNPLASPDILGPASGASLAVMAALLLGGGAGASVGFGAAAWEAGPALAGALGALGLVYALAQRRGVVEPGTLIIIGVTVSIMCGAGVVLLQHLLNSSQVGGRMVALLIGAISDDVPAALVRGVMAAVVGVMVMLVMFGGRRLDALALSDDEARALGVRIGALRALLFVGSGVLTAGAVMIAGPVGFVGLICPHVVRLMMVEGGGSTGSAGGAGGAGGAEGAGGAGGGAAVLSRRALDPQRVIGRGGVLLVASALTGATLLILADGAVRVIDVKSGRLPIGIVTALVGGPMLIALLRGRAARR
ncbi:iron ABC transporter permease [soil metagenome]